MNDLLDGALFFFCFASRTLWPMADEDSHLTPGTLQASLLKRTAHARQCGAIQVLPTTLEVIEAGGIPFQVRVRGFVDTNETVRSTTNPFLPYDPDLFVG